MAGLSGVIQGVKNFLTPGTYQDGTPVPLEQDALFGVDSMPVKPQAAGVSVAQSLAQKYQDAPTAASTVGILPRAPLMQAPVSIVPQRAPMQLPAQSPNFAPNPFQGVRKS